MVIRIRDALTLVTEGQPRQVGEDLPTTIHALLDGRGWRRTSSWSERGRQEDKWGQRESEHGQRPSNHDKPPTSSLHCARVSRFGDDDLYL
jgi:hypothetical protein